MVEKRKFSRVEYKKDVEIIFDGQKCQGEIKNLSLKGAYITSSHQFRIGDQLGLLIHLSGNNDFDIDLKGKIVRLTDDGAGILFERIDLDSFAHLRNIIAYNFGDDDTVMEEFLNSIKNER